MLGSQNCILKFWELGRDPDGLVELCHEIKIYEHLWELQVEPVPIWLPGSWIAAKLRQMLLLTDVCRLG